ncbi:histidine kinase [Piscinibacter sp. XHJ-5]|uniref:sensor histidine kinase n=1 Tax=Piscinibacter sp. XHJ-5 TaxID=3037797 RepID=UPI0024536AB2|nr:histidine kinase [Piscinibacter sp. XHJ-5]
MRRFSAGIRVINAMLCTLLMFSNETRLGVAAALVLGAYDLWAAFVLWNEASGHSERAGWVRYWIDVTWTATVLQLTSTDTSMMVFTLVQPVVLTSIGYGVRRGFTLGLFAAIAVMLDLRDPAVRAIGFSWTHTVPAFGVLALSPIAALLSRPMSVLRQRLTLMAEVESTLDPRRGLETVANALVDALRQGTNAQLAGLVLPASTGAPAILSGANDGTFRASLETHRHIEALLESMPVRPVVHVRRRPWLMRLGLGGHREEGVILDRLDQLAELLEVSTLIVVPLTRYERRHGYLLLGERDRGSVTQDVQALAHAAPEMLRILETATLVDRLHEESTAHERSRIGRDLHDSAIQPYVGLKYAIEGMAMRMPPDNPMYADVQSLLSLVTSEIVELRELISGLRAGEARGDNALVPAVRRQVRRFSVLFGVEVHLDSPNEVATTRVLAAALFHMVNEALNNVRKHTPARHVWIALQETPEAIRLRVRDDAGDILGRAMPDFVPRSLSERAAALGGTLACERPDGINTQLTITIPR